MSQVGKHTTDGDATPDGVVADVACRRLTVRPKLTDITGGFLVYDSNTTVTPFNLAEGEEYTFFAGTDNMFKAGATVGFTKTTNAGPFDFNKKMWTE